MNSVFNREFQHTDLDSKIAFVLERLSQVFNNLLWNQTKNHSLSPIQIKILIFILTNPPEVCTVTELALRFNLTKATVSDAVASLVDKKYVVRKSSSEDRRVIFLNLTSKGKSTAKNLTDWADPIRDLVKATSAEYKTDVYFFLLKLIESLEEAGLISLNKMCITCRFFQKASSDNSLHYCKLLKRTLNPEELRIDCLEYEAA